MSNPYSNYKPNKSNDGMFHSTTEYINVRWIIKRAYLAGVRGGNIGATRSDKPRTLDEIVDELVEELT